MLWRYGLSFYTLKKEIGKLIDKWMLIYKKVYPGSPETFENALEMVNALGLKQYVYTDFSAFLKDLQLNQKFADEFVDCIIASIYNQNNSVNTFSGFISIAGAFNTPYQVEGGNSQIMKRI